MNQLLAHLYKKKKKFQNKPENETNNYRQYYLKNNFCKRNIKY